MKIETVQILFADEGKTFERIKDGEILNDILALGNKDSPENYREIQKPEEEEGVL